MVAKIIMAGIDANAHLTIRTTMEKNGICKSTTITFFASQSLVAYLPLNWFMASIAVNGRVSDDECPDYRLFALSHFN
jgi:hypothetical protein